MYRDVCIGMVEMLKVQHLKCGWCLDLLVRACACSELDEGFRLSYAQLWRALVLADVPRIREKCIEMNVGGMYVRVRACASICARVRVRTNICTDKCMELNVGRLCMCTQHALVCVRACAHSRKRWHVCVEAGVPHIQGQVYIDERV